MPNLIRESVRGMESLTPEDLLFTNREIFLTTGVDSDTSDKLIKQLMIHDPAYGGGDMAGKKPHELQMYVDKLKQSQEIIAGIIAEKTGRFLGEINEKTREDSYFNAQEAIDYGLATGIVDCTNSNRAFLS